MFGYLQLETYALYKNKIQLISKSQFRPGQWLDVHIPDPTIPRPGGFTITSPPSLLKSPSSDPYLELAIQRSSNPPAAWLWRPTAEILGRELDVRVGGSFVWPPEIMAKGTGNGGGAYGIRKVVFVAGGVGINPLISMLSSISETETEDLDIEFLYSIKGSITGNELKVHEVLFLERVTTLLKKLGIGKGRLRLFITGNSSINSALPWEGAQIPYVGRRISNEDLEDALGPVEGRKGTVCYVCGVPGMTDWVVERLSRADGLNSERVFCEKWW